ncbi:MAG: molybdopterin-guanine dinucleotide biosynthesis protein [Pimelobacter sp.]|nr:molybdopterin-guanine dinucleotide biosynthesis protein [Pimelobacter sp.]
MTGTGGLLSYGAVVLAGGQGARLGGFDKASAEVEGRTMLELALDAVVDAAEVVVVGEQVPTERPVTFVLESPRYGGPVAALLTGFDLLLRSTPLVVVTAVDMPHLTHRTVRRLCEGLEAPGGAGGQHGEADGAVLVGPDGRRHLALVLRRERLSAVRPDLEGQHGMSVRDLLADLDLAEVASVGDEHRDVDTWADLRDARAERSTPCDDAP